MNLIHLTASTQYGGPERQMLGLGRTLPADWRSTYVSFAEGGACKTFLAEAARQGFATHSVGDSKLRFLTTVREVTGLLKTERADLLCCHGYKADMLGLWAGRRAGIPVVAVSRGWTWESMRVRCYEMVDRRILRWMDRVVCVSAGQAEKVRRAGVPMEKVAVIRNAIDAGRFAVPNPAYRQKLEAMFPSRPRLIVGAAGRLSPEKGFDDLIEAARDVAPSHKGVGFVLFGDGPLHGHLIRQIQAAGLIDRFILAGFRRDLDKFLPYFDLLVLPSHTEGLPNVVLEACAAGVAVVATAVGGTPEVIEDGVTGRLVPPGQPGLLARAIQEVLHDERERRGMGLRGRDKVREEFTFAAQSEQYQELFQELVPCKVRRPRIRVRLGA